MLRCLTDWLNKHPIDGENDVSFIKKNVAEGIAVAENTAKEKEQEDAASWKAGFCMDGHMS